MIFCFIITSSNKIFVKIYKNQFINTLIWCLFYSNRQYWKGILTGIRKEAYEKAKPLEVTKEMPFNVIMFGFDSLSRNAWIRKLPKSYKYMIEHLGADVLQGYNIVGDGTPQALIPVGFMSNTNNPIGKF